MTGRFVDCSSNNPIPNLAAYKAAGHTGIMRKVTEGTGYRWWEGDGVAASAHRLGLEVGHYHWLRPDQSATAQAKAFVAAVKPNVKPLDWLVTDFERTYSGGQPIPDGSDAARAKQLHDFNGYVMAKLPGVELYVYTGNWYLDGKPRCQEEVRRWGVIMSNYDNVPALPNPYGLHYVAWQFTDRATVAGFSAPVDYNRWLITRTPAIAPRPSPSPIPKDIEDMVIIQVSKADCAKAKVRWPGWFLTNGRDVLWHIPTVPRLNALIRLGLPVKRNYALADYKALGGK